MADMGVVKLQITSHEMFDLNYALLNPDSKYGRREEKDLMQGNGGEEWRRRRGVEEEENVRKGHQIRTRHIIPCYQTLWIQNSLIWML